VETPNYMMMTEDEELKTGVVLFAFFFLKLLIGRYYRWGPMRRSSPMSLC